MYNMKGKIRKFSDHRSPLAGILPVKFSFMAESAEQIFGRQILTYALKLHE